jgi:hypothetical protein
MKKHRWYILLTLLTGILLIFFVFGWRSVVGCTYCWLGGELSIEGGYVPDREVSESPGDWENCTSDTFLDLEFLLHHECRKALESYEMTLVAGEMIYNGSFQSPLEIKNLRRCKDDLRSMLKIYLKNPSTGMQWAWTYGQPLEFDKASRYDILLYAKRRYPDWKDKIYYEYATIPM